MGNRILIVESDAALSRSMREELERRGFQVDETSDGKGSVELVRREMPDLVVLEAELSAGQSGYMVCREIKKDDGLRAIPVVIVGNPASFAGHKKLKMRAEDYVGKPVDMDALVSAVGNLIGMPAAPAAEDEESITLSDLVDVGEDPEPTGEYAAEEIAVESGEDNTVQGDPDLDMLDAAFDDISTDPARHTAESLSYQEEEISAFNDIVEEEAAPPPPPPAPAPRVVTPLGPSRTNAVAAGDAGDLRELRARVAELESALGEANGRIGEQDSRIRELEQELETRSSELDSVRSSGSKHDKEFFALRDSVTKKDKEILRLKTELNEKEKEIVELHEKENQLEQQYSESGSEIARRDAQIKTLTARVDQLSAERKKHDQQLAQAKEEARGATARLTAIQAELDELRSSRDSMESATQEAREETERLRREVEDMRSQLEHERRQLESTLTDLDSAKAQLTTQATAFAEEAALLRKRVAEMEDASSKHEERVTKLYGRIKGEEKVREKTKKALSIALQLLDEQSNLEDVTDEEASL